MVTTDPSSKNAKAEHYELVQDLAKQLQTIQRKRGANIYS